MWCNIFRKVAKNNAGIFACQDLVNIVISVTLGNPAAPRSFVLVVIWLFFTEKMWSVGGITRILTFCEHSLVRWRGSRVFSRSDEVSTGGK